MRDIEEIKEDLAKAKIDLNAAEKEVYFQELKRDNCKTYVREFQQELAMNNGQK